MYIIFVKGHHEVFLDGGGNELKLLFKLLPEPTLEQVNNKKRTHHPWYLDIYVFYMFTLWNLCNF